MIYAFCMIVFAILSLMKKYYFVALTFICTLMAGFAETENPSLKDSNELISEGFQQLKSGHKDDALATFNEVLRQDSTNLNARLGQAIVFTEQERYRDAFDAYDWIIQYNPKFIDAWNGRGMAAFHMEDFDEAMASFQMSIADQPVNGFFYESIAWTQMCQGKFQKAAESAKQASLMYGRKGKTSFYPMLIAYFSYHESGDAENAMKVLNYAIKNNSFAQWPAPVINYLNNTIDEAGLISSVLNLSEETEAHTYIGLQMRLLGKMDEAERHFSWVRRNGDPKVFEYTLAKVLVPHKDVASLEL